VKKLVLLLVCAMLMTVFIALNYLLWDKEQNTQNIKSLEYKNDDKDATINALGREIKNLEDASKEYNNRIKILESNNSELQNKYDESMQTQQESKELLERKNDIITVLKQQADLKPLEALIKKWAESIDKGQYETAYKIELQHFKDNGEIISLNEYSDSFKKAVKNIKVKAVKLYNEEVQGLDDADIVFLVTFDVNKVENSESGMFTEGDNDKLFSMTYDKDQGGWIISDIVVYKKEP
jgi:predicted RNase H-like nuclease (RuvC/YqgF family)